MRYLVTGHKGFIGSNLLKYIEELGFTYTGLDTPECDLCWSYHEIPWPSDVDVIIHLAALTDVRWSISNPSVVIENNCRSLLNTLSYAASTKARLIFTSSYAARDPINPYGASKAACEAICRAYRVTYDVDVVILRLPNIYGPHSAHKTSIIPKIIKTKLNSDSIPIYGDGLQTRDFVYVGDVCRMICSSTRDTELSSGSATNVIELLSILDHPAPAFVPPLTGEVRKITPGPQNCYYPLKDGLDLTLKWFEKNYKPDN